MKTVNNQNMPLPVFNLFRHLQSVFNYVIITPLYYQGAIGGSQFVVYDAAILYLALSVEFTHINQAQAPPISYIEFYDETNFLIYSSGINYPSWDGAALKYVGQPMIKHNIYFSKIVQSNYNRMHFNGYKLEP